MTQAPDPGLKIDHAALYEEMDKSTEDAITRGMGLEVEEAEAGDDEPNEPPTDKEPSDG